MIKVEYKHTEISAKKKLGQNFLIDRNISRKIVVSSEIGEKDNILEIGPGFGALTKEIINICPTFTAVEKDPNLAIFIREEYPQVNVIEADILDTNIELLAKEKPLKVLGNIPYSITSPIIFKLLEHRQSLISATLMMQHEVAMRIVAKPSTKDYGILAVQLQAFCNVTYLFKVGRKVFRPQPEIDSAVVNITPKKDNPVNDAKGFSKFVRIAFHQRRKTLLNNLKEYYNLEAVGSNALKQRAEALSIEEFFILFNQLKTLE
ncbi:MAG: 16S rRNA (adenine(1518)-N(6)/adenine(1519)-N(6))-dimethyltransferase RsmA [Chlorobiaceae bacterium]